jgi:histidine ammonia-lyase
LHNIVLDGESLTVVEVVQASVYPGVEIRASEESLKKVEKNRRVVDKLLKSGEPIYGLNTGFGSKANVRIDEDNLKKLQKNLILSHSTGVGDELPIEIIRSAMLLRTNTILKGNSGVRPVIVQTLIKMLNNGIVPVVPSQGSVSASRDLAPLSHITLVMMKGDEENSGEAYLYDKPSDDWHRMSGKKAMELAGIERIELEPKEGLALNNGLQVTTAIACHTLQRAKKVLEYSHLAMAMSAESLLASSSPFSEKIHLARPHPGILKVAKSIRKLIEGSELIDSNPENIQDAYSIRCYPEVAGVLKETIDKCEKTLNIEINSSTDNPLVFTDGEDVISGGNFHGEPIANALDCLTIALTELAGISERRTFRLLDGKSNAGLPSMLIENSGLQNGFMLAQYTSASLASQNKILSYPSCVDSIPTSENQEDYVSMSLTSALKGETVSKNTQYIIAIEILTASQALDFRMSGISYEPHLDNLGNLISKKITTESVNPSPIIKKAHNKLRETVHFREEDGILSRDIEKIYRIIENDLLNLSD